MQQTPFHAYYTARQLDTLPDADKLLPVFASSDIQAYPFQIAAASFALRSPYQKGVILCDEAGMGKSHEAMLIMAQRGMEGQTKILLCIPTLLTPATVNEILVQSGRLKDFLNNPEAFLEKAIELIKNNRHALAIDGIRYVKLDGKEYYVQEIFDTAELIANLDRNAVKVEHSVYDYIVYDSSTVERPFALALDNDPDVKMFFKIPDRFKIDTPIGAYNPDWAVYLTKNGEEKLYFILETKGSDSFMDLRTREQLKIHCGKKHFEALENGIEMQVATDWHEIKARV